MRNALDPCLFACFNLHSGGQQVHHEERMGGEYGNRKGNSEKRKGKEICVYIHLEHNWESFKRVMNS